MGAPDTAGDGWIQVAANSPAGGVPARPRGMAAERRVPVMIPSVVVPQDRWTSNVLREAAKYVNLVVILARVHRRPEAIEFLTYLGIPDPPHPPPRSPTGGEREKRVSRMGRSGKVA